MGRDNEHWMRSTLNTKPQSTKAPIGPQKRDKGKPKRAFLGLETKIHGNGLNWTVWFKQILIDDYLSRIFKT